MPSKASLTSLQRPVVLTGFDLEIECPKCRSQQICADDGNARHAIAGDEFVALHGFPGRYMLTYRLHCWSCSCYFSGRLVIRSRSAPFPQDPGMGRV